MSVPAYKVLVVEDEKLIRDNMVEKIELCDPCFTVVAAASNGAEALDLLRSRGVDVVLTDVRMPVMDGLTLAQQVRSEFPHVSVVIVSGYADFAYAQQAIHAGVEEYLLKPVKVDLLADTLSRIKTKLAEADSRSRYELIREAVNGNPQETCITAQQAYQLLLLNVGNLCSTVASAATRNAFGVLWQRFDFAALRAAHPDGMFVDAPQPNGRYLVWPVQGTVSHRSGGRRPGIVRRAYAFGHGHQPERCLRRCRRTDRAVHTGAYFELRVVPKPGLGRIAGPGREQGLPATARGCAGCAGLRPIDGSHHPGANQAPQTGGAKAD